MRTLFSLAAAALLLTGLPFAAAACPFCSAPSMTLTEQLAKSDAALLASLKSSKQAVDDQPAESQLVIVDILRDTTKTHEKGKSLSLPRYIELAADEQVLLLGTKLDVLEWSDPLPLGKETLDYVKSAPLLDAPPTERLAYFLGFLEHPSLTIANDAYSEFANAPYKDIVPLAPKMPREKLRQWVMNPETSPTRLGLYGLMLGLCGDETDAKLMEAKVVDTDENDYRLGIDGVIAGYLLITSDKGLDIVDSTKLKADAETKIPFSETYAALQALRFMWQYGDGKISHDRLKASMRILLDRPELADIVIADLARWKDWSIQERLRKLYGQDAYNVPSIKRAIIRYMFAGLKDVPKDAPKDAPIPAHVQAATKYLEELRAQDPKLVKDVERFLY